ncbi:hemolysin-like protein [Vibrio cholerae]|nr:hemolysin-like protein [Vibrio cholerae]
MLSDWDNLSYNRLAVFGGNTQNEQMRAVRSLSGLGKAVLSNLTLTK